RVCATGPMAPLTCSAEVVSLQPTRAIEVMRTFTTRRSSVLAPMDLTLECGDLDNAADYAAWLMSFMASDNCGVPTVTNDGLAFEIGMTQCSPRITGNVTMPSYDGYTMHTTLAAVVRQPVTAQ